MSNSSTYISCVTVVFFGEYTTQGKFLTKLGIQQRAEIISKNKSFSQKADIFYRLKRLIDKKEMGDLFKVMLIKKSNNNFQIGF